LGITYVIITTVLFLFPPELPVTGSNMNYCIVAFSVWLAIAVFQWFIDGRKNYTGPKVDIDHHVLVATPTVEGHEAGGLTRNQGHLGSEKTSGSDMAQDVEKNGNVLR